MSERTTIGGVTYEVVGSNTSNLLLKCNGTARIQWGNKLIDLIKNGKIAAGSDSEQLFVISDESEIKSDGFYVINKDESQKFLVCKNGERYNLNGADLYISASTKQDFTVDQQKQALYNIGLYYDTLEDIQAAGIKEGLAYVAATKKLYTIQNGVVEEFKAELKTIAVEKENKEGEIINNSVKIIMSILQDEYIILQDSLITINKTLSLKDGNYIQSEMASEKEGFRLYIDRGKSCLEVDSLVVRDNITGDTINYQNSGTASNAYVFCEFSELREKMTNQELIPNQEYVISNFQNHWKLPANSTTFNRPIVVKALTNSTLYLEGYLYNQQNISIHYDPTFVDLVASIDSNGNMVGMSTARGKIVWMKDFNDNEANFDFLDYTNAKAEPLTTLHESPQLKDDLSIFPSNSKGNKVNILYLKGTLLNSSGLIINEGSRVKFECETMLNNQFTCTDFIIDKTCSKFCDNIFTTITDLTIKQDVTNSRFGDVTNCEFNSKFDQVNFKNLHTCAFNGGSLNHINCHSNIANYIFSEENNTLLYTSDVIKQVYFSENVLEVVCERDHYFHRGMIMMHSGAQAIPDGWAVCDGQTYTYNGVETTTPNLINKFIKAVGSVDDVGEVNNPDLNESNEFCLQERHLPEHHHAHVPHTHTISDINGSISTSDGLSSDFIDSDYLCSLGATSKDVVSSVEGEGITTNSIAVLESIIADHKGGKTSVEEHSHDFVFSEGTLSEETSIESESVWENQVFKIEPNYYSLIFIMKL